MASFDLFHSLKRKFFVKIDSLLPRPSLNCSQTLLLLNVKIFSYYPIAWCNYSLGAESVLSFFLILLVRRIILILTYQFNYRILLILKSLLVFSWKTWKLLTISFCESLNFQFNIYNAQKFRWDLPRPQTHYLDMKATYCIKVWKQTYLQQKALEICTKRHPWELIYGPWMFITSFNQLYKLAEKQWGTKRKHQENVLLPSFRLLQSRVTQSREVCVLRSFR